MATAKSSKGMTQTEIISQLAEKSGMKKSGRKRIFHRLSGSRHQRSQKER